MVDRLERVHAKVLGNTDGNVADYIPELSKVDPDLFGIAVVTSDGHASTRSPAPEPCGPKT